MLGSIPGHSRLESTGSFPHVSIPIWTPTRQHRSTPRPLTRAQQSDAGDGIKRLFKRVQGALPVVGLISRLATPEGGIGSDELAYPEYSRVVFDAAPPGFQIAVADLQNKYGKAAQRRYVLLVMWMARQGGGVVPGKVIVDAARRLRVSQDLEYEMDRFSQELEAEIKKYSYMDRPRGKPQDQATVAIDGLARLCLALPDGEPIPEEDAPLIADAVCGGLMEDGPAFRELVKVGIETRAERAKAYV